MNAERIKTCISSFVLLTDQEYQQLFDKMESKTLRKNSLFLKEGQICDSIAFVNRGALVYFKALETGKEVTTDFAFTGEWITDNRSRLGHLPSLLNIKAIEETELLIITNEELNNCYSQIPVLEKLGRILIEQAFVKIAQQSIDLQVLSATERYIKLLGDRREVFQKIPLYHIANYLGIAPKSLSRIRKKVLCPCF